MSEDYLTQGISAVKAGNKQEARKLLDAAIRAAPNDERTWGWFINVCENDTERLKCLKEILRINPNHEQAKQRYNELTGLAMQPTAIAPAAPTIIKKPWYRSAGWKIAFFLFFTPIWTLIVIDDPESSTTVKVVAIVLFVIYILLACQWLTGYSPIRLF
jgi:hypothetical protein